MGQEVHVDLGPADRELLASGLLEWAGPASIPAGLAAMLEFDGAEQVAEWLAVTERDLRANGSLVPLDWVRCLVLTEIAFVSDVLGSGWDWSATTGLSDEETIQRLRSVQERLGHVRTGVHLA